MMNEGNLADFSGFFDRKKFIQPEKSFLGNS